MPLPKTATIAARATEVYCDVWNVVLKKTPKMPATDSDLSELGQLLPYLRQLLTCCACAGLLNNAMISLTCGHCYCYECQFKEPLLKIQCKQCRERNGLVMENQLQLLVKCYRHMCYIIGEEVRKKSQNPAHHNNSIRTENSKDEAEDKRNENVNTEIPNEISSKKISALASDPSFDPVAEIVREVEKGTKVSRATLIIKPPSKYLNAKVAVVPKKEQATAHSGRNRNLKKSIPAKKRSRSVKNVARLDEPSLSDLELESKVDRPKRCKEDVAVDMVNFTPTRRKRTGRSSMFVPNSLSKSRVRKQKKRMSNSKIKTEAEVVTESATSGDEPERENDSLELAQLPKVPASDQTEIKMDELEVCVNCLRKDYISITAEAVVLLPQAEPANILLEAATAPIGSVGKAASSEVGQWKGTVRRRKWGPFCPRVEVKRPREDIAKVILIMQSRAAKGRGNSHHGKIRQKASESLTSPLLSPLVFTPPSSSSSTSSLPPPPSRSHPIITHDLPIPDHISLLSNDGREDILDADIDWTEFSDFLESADEESTSTLQSLGRLTTPQSTPRNLPAPHNHPTSHNQLTLQNRGQGIDHFRFGDFANSRVIHPQYHPHSPHLHPPPHLSRRPAHLPRPLIPTYTPPLEADVPQHGSYLSPMVPDDFISGRIGMGGRGFASPLTPRRSYSCSGPEGAAYQHSPSRQHPPGNCFQISPNMARVNFSPQGRRPYPGPIVISKTTKKSPTGMSSFVAKMKLSSPVLPKKKCPTPEDTKSPVLPINQPSPSKKRRSPGYSEAGWRCRCGTNNVMFPEKVCAKGKCPCYTKGMACKNCLCRYCHNPFGAREKGAATNTAVDTVDTISE